MEVRCSVPEKIVLSVSVVTVKSEDTTLMPASVAARAGTWLGTSYIKEVRQEVILNLV